MKSDRNKLPDENPWSAFALVGQVGLTISLSMLAGIGVGLLIDNHFGTRPVATLIGLLLGLAAGVYGVYRLISAL